MIKNGRFTKKNREMKRRRKEKKKKKKARQKKNGRSPEGDVKKKNLSNAEEVKE